MAKLNKEKVIAIRELYSSGKFKQKEIAKMFNVNPRTINSIVLKHHWKWVKG